MPLYDRRCPSCGQETIDCWEPMQAPTVPCEGCGTATERAWLTKAASVVADDIPGGVWIRHGICNEDGSPRKYYSKSEMAAEAKRRGLVNRVEHVTQPGTDRNPHTTRWI